MHIQVLGTGCAKCAETDELLRKLIEKLGVDATCEKVSDLKAIMQMGVLSTPAVVIDGEVKCTGRMPSEDEARAWLTDAGRA